MIKFIFRENTFIEIQLSTLVIFRKYIQVGNKKEAGGVLVGKRLKNGDLVIVCASEPTSLDKRAVFSFRKSPKSHKIFISNYQSESNGFIGFVGEWHSHPEKIPTPSETDYKSWRKIMKNNKDDSLVFIIVGIMMTAVYYLVDNSWKEIKFNVISEVDK